MSLSSRTRGRRWRSASAVAAAAALMLVSAAGLASASDVDVTSVVDTTAPTGSVTLAPGGDPGAIAINLTVTGNQAGTATFKVYQDWSLSDGAFTGSNPKTFTVGPQGGGTTTALSTTGTVSVAADQADGTFILSVGTFDVTNTNSTGAKLSAGDSANYSVKVETPAPSDTTPPVLSLPADITAEATSASGAVVTYSVSATDAVDGPVPANCTPLSGSTFALGTSGVTCSATDAANNTATGTFNITVQDTTAPVVTVPADITAEATGPSGAAVTFSASATDAVDGTPAVTCDPASDSTFALGETTVTCDSTDTAGNTGSNTFKVTVQDTTAPALTLPADITAEAASAAGAAVSYSASATDLVDGAVSPSCAPASGSVFPLGTTTVSCSATDDAGNTATDSFDVTVRVPWAGILQPINANGTSVFKLGSTVPVKFNGFAGLTATLKVTKHDSTPDGTYVEPVNSNPADSGWVFRYDVTGGQYIYNLGTKNLTAGDWYLHIDLGDGVDHVVKISLKK